METKEAEPTESRATERDEEAQMSQVTEQSLGHVRTLGKLRFRPADDNEPR